MPPTKLKCTMIAVQHSHSHAKEYITYFLFAASHIYFDNGICGMSQLFLLSVLFLVADIMMTDSLCYGRHLCRLKSHCVM